MRQLCVRRSYKDAKDRCYVSSIVSDQVTVCMACENILPIIASSWTSIWEVIEMSSKKIALDNKTIVFREAAPMNPKDSWSYLNLRPVRLSLYRSKRQTWMMIKQCLLQWIKRLRQSKFHHILLLLVTEWTKKKIKISSMTIMQSLRNTLKNLGYFRSLINRVKRVFLDEPSLQILVSTETLLTWKRLLMQKKQVNWT